VVSSIFDQRRDHAGPGRGAEVRNLPPRLTDRRAGSRGANSGTRGSRVVRL